MHCGSRVFGIRYRWFLDKKHVQVLALVIVDEGFHARPQFHYVQLEDSEVVF